MFSGSLGSERARDALDPAMHCLGGAVIFKSGFDVKGIKAAAAIWITGALGLAIATSYWWLGITVGLVTAAVMYVADSFPDEVREEKQETPNPGSDAKK